MAPSLPPGIKEHPNRGASVGMVVVGATLIAGGAGALAMGIGAVSPFFLAIGPVFVAIGLYNRSTGRGAQILNKALDLVLSGRLDEAEALLAYAAPRVKHGHFLRIIDLQRAMIAMRTGELERALAFADAACARPIGLLAKGLAEVHRAEAQGLRALLRASLGKVEEARADIAAVRASADALPGALARVELAEAIALERRRELAALGSHLRRERRLLREYTMPRERAIVRAYERMLGASATTVYRQSAPREAPERTSGEPALADWVAKLSPGAAAFVRSPAHGERESAGRDEGVAASAVVDPEVLGSARKRAVNAASGQARKVLLLWVLLIAMFMAIWTVLSPTRSPAPVGYIPPPLPIDEGMSGLWMLLMTGGIFGFLALVIGLLTRRHLQALGRLRAAQRALAREDDETAMATLRELTGHSAKMIAANAELSLAMIAERNGDVAGALACCDQGIASCAAAGAMSADILRPSLLAERAFLLVALGRTPEARAELAVIEETSTSYPLLGKARFLVDLLDALRGGEVEKAGRLARGSGELPLGSREEMLADLARVLARPEEASAGEVEWLERELREDDVSRRWLTAFAPGVLSAFEGARGERKGEVEATRDREAEEEAARERDAEDEAAGAEEAEGGPGRKVLVG